MIQKNFLSAYERIIKRPQIKELEPKQEDFISLETIFEKDEKIKKIIDGSKNAEFTEPILKDFETALENKNFTFNEQDWEKMMEIIEQSFDFKNAQPKTDSVTVNSNKMENIYNEFPMLLLKLYFKNKTGVDYMTLFNILYSEETKEEDKKKTILQQFQMETVEEKIDTIEKFIKTAENFNEQIKIFELKNPKLDLLKFKDRALERIRNIFSEPNALAENLEDMFKEELDNLKEKEIKKIEEETDY